MNRGDAPRVGWLAARPNHGLLVITLGYVALVLYLSLIPFNFQPPPWDEWLERALAMRYYGTPINGLADWHVLFLIPAGFLFASVINAYSWGTLPRPAVAVGGFLVAALLAFGIEVLQITVPMRTSSLTDVVAGALGGALGAAVWWGAGRRLWNLVESATARSSGRRGFEALLWIYLLLYAVLALFPFDFAVTPAALGDVWARGNQHWWIREGCGGWGRCAGEAALDVVAALPIGLLLALRVARARRSLLLALLLGLVLGLVVEGLQLFSRSGITEGVSVVMRGIGVVLGAKLYVVIRNRPRWLVAPELRWWALILTPLYLAFTMYLTGVFAAEWNTAAAVGAELERLRFLPFYYHNFVGQTEAAFSFVMTVVMYVPVGLAAWCVLPRLTGRHWLWAAALGALWALVLETGKLLAVDARPDSTSILIAACAAGLTYALMRMLAAQFAAE